MAYEAAGSSSGPRWAIPEKFLSWDVDHTRFEMKRILGKGESRWRGQACVLPRASAACGQP